MRRPAFVLACPFVLGLAVGGQHASVVALTDMVLAAALGALACAIASHRGRAWRWAAIALAALALGMATGARDAPLREQPPLRGAFAAHLATGTDADPIHLTGLLRSDAQPGRDGGASFILDPAEVDGRVLAGRVRGPGTIRVTVAGQPEPPVVESWREGSTVRVPVFLRVPSSYRNPGVEDAALALARRDIALVGSVKSGALVDVVRPAAGLDAWAADTRGWVRRTIRRHLASQDRAAAICLAILIGDRTGLDDATVTQLRRAGTFHVIAISGGNVALFTAACLAVLRVLRARPRLAAAVTIGALLAFGLVVERGASVDRAVTVAVIYLAAQVLDHRASPLNVVGLAALGIGWLDPAIVFDVGALLTFGATVGLLAGAAAMAGWMRGHLPAAWDARGLPVRAATMGIDAVAATLAAEAAVAPIAAVAFGQVTFAGILLNLVAIPAMAVVQFGGMAILAASQRVPALMPAAVWLTAGASDALVESAGVVDYLPWLVVDTPGLAALARAPPLAPIPHSDARRVDAPLLRVTFLDVGQGDATLVQFPSGASLLVDAGGTPGGSFDMGARVIAPAVRALGVSRLTWLALTHGDPDHIGGAARVVDLLHPAEVWEGVPVPPYRPLADIHDAARRAGVPVREVATADVLRIDEVEVRVLHPPRPDWERQRVRNDDSIVIELRYGDVQIILPGDIGQAIERDLVTRIARRGRLVLKAAHHGSLTSSGRDWVRALRPDAVVFSIGQANRFGHPAPAVVDRFVEARSEMFRTDRDGAIQMATDGTQVWAVTMNQRRWWRGARP